MGRYPASLPPSLGAHSGMVVRWPSRRRPRCPFGDGCASSADTVPAHSRMVVRLCTSSQVDRLWDLRTPNLRCQRQGTRPFKDGCAVVHQLSGLQPPRCQPASRRRRCPFGDGCAPGPGAHSGMVVHPAALEASALDARPFMDGCAVVHRAQRAPIRGWLCAYPHRRRRSRRDGARAPPRST